MCERVGYRFSGGGISRLEGWSTRVEVDVEVDN